jgi:hypothetical protein
MTIKPCKLCDPNLDREIHDFIWRAFVDGGRGRAVIASQSRNIAIDEREVRRHFEYHRPVQAPPNINVNKDELEKIIKKTPQRRRSLIELAFRLGSVDERLASNLIYWSGNPDKLVAANKAAARDLKMLVNNDFLFRIYPENLPGKTIGLSQPAVFFLGSNGRYFLNSHSDFIVTGKDIAKTPEEKKNWSNILKINGPNLIFYSLIENLNQTEEPLLKRGEFGGVKVEVSGENFLAKEFIKIKLRDPSKNFKELKMSGAGGIVFKDKKDLPLLAPFLYYFDDGRRRPEKVIDDILTGQVLIKTGQVKDVFPQFQKAQTIPTIVIAEKNRLNKLLDESRSKRNLALPDSLVLLTEKTEKNVFTEPIWVDLFSGKKKDSLIKELILTNKNNPVQSDKLIIKTKKAKS